MICLKTWLFQRSRTCPPLSLSKFNRSGTGKVLKYIAFVQKLHQESSFIDKTGSTLNGIAKEPFLIKLKGQPMGIGAGGFIENNVGIRT